RKANADAQRKYFAENPAAREEFSKRAKEQWRDEKLRAWRAEKTRAQWTPEYRRRHIAAVKRWWQAHPEHAEKLILASQRTWADSTKRRRIERGFRRWRETVPPEERGRLLREGHRLKALRILNAVL